MTRFLQTPFFFLLTLGVVLGFALPMSAEETSSKSTSQVETPTKDIDMENRLYLDTTYGRTVIDLRPDLAPKHVERIKELVRKGFYDGLTFHRVMEGFMAQTGDPRGDGTGGSGQNLAAEFNAEPFVEGTLGMARAASPDSADSQFFITFADASFLNGQYTVFGKVVEGMEFIHQVKKAPAGRASGKVDDPDLIVKLQVAADVKE